MWPSKPIFSTNIHIPWLMIFFGLLLSFDVQAKGEAGKKAAGAAGQKVVGSECLKKVETLVRETSKRLGLKDKFGIQWAEPVIKGRDSHDNIVTEYASGVFLLDGDTEDSEGFIPDSGARVLTIRDGKSCKVTRLEVAVGVQ